MILFLVWYFVSVCFSVVVWVVDIVEKNKFSGNSSLVCKFMFLFCYVGNVDVNFNWLVSLNKFINRFI